VIVTRWGENVARAETTAAVHEGLMDCPAHRANTLARRLTQPASHHGFATRMTEPSDDDDKPPVPKLTQ
jgi:hypothetical protein